ncbi:hypothetical protein FZD47_21030 [Bacillus infantis]|uniref:Uncharacterized protein n=1 Tax=Bacillus infantis TaxID=324767 RepID=A0A5D4SF09_9BACI|nr:hypothetical protein [Bacillus infantis]TYS60694.1 hypothetical protein FZD47_21030 [Bacillus infantis]
MKTILLIGTRSKADFSLYLSHMMTSMEKRVLLVDVTAQQQYRHGYTRLRKEEQLFDFQGIDILCGPKSWLQIEEQLRINQESTTNYDVVMVDIDTPEALGSEWPEFDHRFYIGDEDRLHQTLDVELLHRLFDETENTELSKITFEGKYELDSTYFNNLMNNRPRWVSVEYFIELDDLESSLRFKMQHETIIPFKKLSKPYKETLSELISSIFHVHKEEVKGAAKQSFFRFGSKRKQEIPQFADTNA